MKLSLKLLAIAAGIFSLTAARPTFATSPDYTVTTSSGASIVPGDTDIGNHCDDCGTGIALPFPVTFYDQVFTAATVWSNGNLVFTAGEGCCSLCLPDGSANNLIAPAWVDYYTADSGNGQGIFTSISGTAPNRILNIEWRVRPCCSGGAPTDNFEVRLYEGEQRIDFIYGALSYSNPRGIGVQRDTGSQYTLGPLNCGIAPSAGTQYTLEIAPSCAPAPAGMVSWWKAEGNADDSQDDNHGTLQGGATFAPGKVGQAFSFDGNNQYVLIADPVPANLQIQNEITLDAWIYVTSYPDSNSLGLIVGSQYDVTQSGATIFWMAGRIRTGKRRRQAISIFR
jgi:hypothetical protein